MSSASSAFASAAAASSAEGTPSGGAACAPEGSGVDGVSLPPGSLEQPVSSSSAVFHHLNPELQTEYVQETARERFVHATGGIFDEAVAAIQTSGRLVRRLQRLRRRFLAVIRAVWHLLF